MLPLDFLWKIKGKSINPGWSISSFFKIPFFFLLFFFSPIHVFQRVIIKFKDCNSDRIHYILKIKGSKENKKNSNRLNTLPVRSLFTKITESLVQTNPNHLLPTFFTTFYKIDIFKNRPSIPVDVNDRKRAKGGLFWKKKKRKTRRLISSQKRNEGGELAAKRLLAGRIKISVRTLLLLLLLPIVPPLPPLVPLVARLKPVAGDPWR